MEYQKYLKYKSKYLQLKYKIENEAKTYQNSEENNGDSNIIVHARSPLRHMRLHTYENEQEGGFTLTTGYYAFFCNSKYFPNYKKNDIMDEKLSDITTKLSYKGYSFKLFTERSIKVFGKVFGKTQGNKLNLVISTSLNASIKRYLDEVDGIDPKIKYKKENSLMRDLVVSTGKAFHIIGMITLFVPTLLFKFGSAVVGHPDSDKEIENWWKLREPKLEEQIKKYEDDYKSLKPEEKKKKSLNDYKIQRIDKEKEEQQNLVQGQKIYIPIILPLPDNVTVPIITNVTKKGEEISFNNVAQDTNTQVNTFLEEVLKDLNTKKFFNAFKNDATENQKKSIEEGIIKLSKEDRWKYRSDHKFKMEKIEEWFAQYNNPLNDDFKDRANLNYAGLNTKLFKNMEEYNKENIIDCCVIIKINSTEKNIFIKRYKLNKVVSTNSTGITETKINIVID